MGVIDRSYCDRDLPVAVRIHRDAFLGPGAKRAALAPLQLWLLGRWLTSGAERAIAAVKPERVERFTAATGVSAERQRARLASLAKRHAIGPNDAYRLGLLRDGWPERWAEFAYDGELWWNAAASSPAGAEHIRTLGDKAATERRLTTAGIPCVPSIAVAPDTFQADSDALIAQWLTRWPKVHGKQRLGSRGEGAFELSQESSGWLLREHQHGTPVADPRAWLREHLSATDYLIQPRLVSHPVFAGIADPSDVVTIRIVTRDVGTVSGRAAPDPRVFSSCVEVPLPPTNDAQYYALMRLHDNGSVAGTALPQWLSGSEAQQDYGTREVERALSGTLIPGFDDLVDQALRAHRLFPGLFAAAWDAAVTDQGIVFLEGNTGFGTDVPQWLGGGLFADLDGRPPPGDIG